MPSTEQTIERLERELKKQFELFNRQVEERLGQFITLSGINFDALRIGMTEEIQTFAAELVNVMILGGQISAENASDPLGRVVAFDPADGNAVLVFAALKNRVIQGLQQQQLAALEELRRQAGLVVPIRNFREIRQSLTLTAAQVRAIANYRSLLEANSLESLTRELRDRRFDSTVRRAARLDEPLTAEQIDNMVDRYRFRQLDFRARTIAATEAVRIANEADDLFWRQLVDRGDVNRNDLKRVWVTSKDSKVRDTHRGLDDTSKLLGDPWVTSTGSLLRFPGDPTASLKETINCRCWISTEVIETALDREVAA